MKPFHILLLLIGLLGGALLSRILSPRTPTHFATDAPSAATSLMSNVTNVVLVSIYKTNFIELRSTNWPYSRYALELALRDERATLSSRKRAESYQEEYAKLFDSIGSSPGTLEKVLPMIARVAQRAFLGEAAILDHINSQIEFTNELATILTPDQFKQFLAHEENRLFDMEMDRLARFSAASPLSEETIKLVQDEAKHIGVYTDGSAVLGPLDPTPQPTAGVDASLEWNRARLKLAESIRDRMMSSISGKIPESEAAKVSAYYASIMEKRQKAIDDLTEMSKLSTKEFLQQGRKRRKD